MCDRTIQPRPPCGLPNSRTPRPLFRPYWQRGGHTMDPRPECSASWYPEACPAYGTDQVAPPEKAPLEAWSELVGPREGTTWTNSGRVAPAGTPRASTGPFFGQHQALSATSEPDDGLILAAMWLSSAWTAYSDVPSRPAGLAVALAVVAPAYPAGRTYRVPLCTVPAAKLTLSDGV